LDVVSPLLRHDVAVSFIYKATGLVDTNILREREREREKIKIEDGNSS
jgi:hypothetical protein